MSLTAGFTEFSGAVGNGIGVAPDYVFLSQMNGQFIAPTEPIPGLEDLFIPPDPNDPNSLGQGIGHATVDLGGSSSISFDTQYYDPNDEQWHVGVENLISFTAGPDVNVAPGEEFLLGTFALQNGEWWAASPIHRFKFEIVTHSSDPALDGHVFSDTLILNITPNGGPPEMRADFYYFENHPELGEMRVLEGIDGNNYGTAELYGKIGSLTPTGFRNPTGGLFLTAYSPPTVVPEPATITLVGTGLIGLLVMRLRTRRG